MRVQLSSGNVSVTLINPLILERYTMCKGIGLILPTLISSTKDLFVSFRLLTEKCTIRVRNSYR